MTNVVLESLLKPLEEFYRPSFVEEIAINHAGEVWMRLNGGRVPWVSYNAEILSKQYLVDLIHTVANIYERPFDPIHGVPVVYATLPGNHRFSAIAGPNVQYDENDVTGGVALNIRGEGVAETSFENYHLKRGQKLLKVKPRENVRPDDPYDRLMSAINDGSPILISGATSTGKTSTSCSKRRSRLRSTRRRRRTISSSDTSSARLTRTRAGTKLNSRFALTNTPTFPSADTAFRSSTTASTVTARRDRRFRLRYSNARRTPIPKPINITINLRTCFIRMRATYRRQRRPRTRISSTTRSNA